jgi:hypothetical protein
LQIEIKAKKDYLLALKSQQEKLSLGRFHFTFKGLEQTANILSVLKSTKGKGRQTIYYINVQSPNLDLKQGISYL